MTKQNDEEKVYSKDVVLVIAASFFFMFSNMYCNPLINGYAQELGANSAFAGVIVGMMSIVAMFLRPIAGNLTDRFSKYQLSFIGGGPQFSWGSRLRHYVEQWSPPAVSADQRGRVRALYGLYDHLALLFGAVLPRWGGDELLRDHERPGDGLCAGSFDRELCRQDS